MSSPCYSPRQTLSSVLFKVFSGDFPPFRLVFVLFVSFVVHSSAKYPVGCNPGRASVRVCYAQEKLFRRVAHAGKEIRH